MERNSANGLNKVEAGDAGPHEFNQRRAPMKFFAGRKGAIERSYVSDFTRYINRFMDQHPEERRVQRDGWLIYWEKRLNLKFQRALEESNVPTPGYYYFDPPPARNREVARKMWRP
jgi:hypothetical protein